MVGDEIFTWSLKWKQFLKCLYEFSFRSLLHRLVQKCSRTQFFDFTFEKIYHIAICIEKFEQKTFKI